MRDMGKKEAEDVSEELKRSFKPNGMKKNMPVKPMIRSMIREDAI